MRRRRLKILASRRQCLCWYLWLKTLWQGCYYDLQIRDRELQLIRKDDKELKIVMRSSTTAFGQEPVRRTIRYRLERPFNNAHLI
jgi:hypothetical protein